MWLSNLHRFAPSESLHLRLESGNTDQKQEMLEMTSKDQVFIELTGKEKEESQFAMKHQTGLESRFLLP